jgi:hypothetical protein
MKLIFDSLFNKRYIFFTTIALTGLPVFNIHYICWLGDKKNIHYSYDGTIYAYDNMNNKRIILPDEMNGLQYIIHNVLGKSPIMYLPIISLSSFMYTLPATYLFLLDN